VNELVHQLEMTKAKLLIAHPSNVDTAVKAAMTVGLPKSNILLFGDKSVDGLLTFRQALFSERRAAPVEIKPHEVRTRVAYLCFSSGTTGNFAFSEHKNRTDYPILDNLVPGDLNFTSTNSYFV
jgi:acyl-coenzyme A synthetase/AMP-(fatty) acid ligase